MSWSRLFFLSSAMMVAIFSGEPSSPAATITLPPQQVSKTYSNGLDFEDFSSLSLNRFNPALGSLSSVDFQLRATISRGVLVENLTGSPKQITSTISTTLSILRPDGTTQLSLSDADTVTDDLSAYDGTTDFGGPSGRTHNNLLFVDESQGSVIDTDDLDSLAMFIGTGTIVFPFSARTPSSSDGGGQAFTTDGEVTVTLTVTYTYNEIILSPTPLTVVPEPSSFALLGIGGGCTLLLSHWRRRSRRIVA